MRLSRASTYAFYGLSYITSKPAGTVVALSAIGQGYGVPEKHLAKIFRFLVRAGILTSVRGVKGGFALARPATEISPLEVIEAVDGPVPDTGCLLLGEPCNRAGVCRINALWRRAQRQMLAVLREASLADIAPEPGQVIRPPQLRRRTRVPGSSGDPTLRR
jgi:Rrf2 family protein